MSRSKSRRDAANQSVDTDSQPAPDAAPEPAPRPTPHRRGRPRPSANPDGQSSTATGQPAPAPDSNAGQPAQAPAPVASDPDNETTAPMDPVVNNNQNGRPARVRYIAPAAKSEKDVPEKEKAKRKWRPSFAVVLGLFIVLALVGVGCAVSAGSKNTSSSSVPPPTYPASTSTTTTAPPATTTTAAPTTTSRTQNTTTPTTTRRAGSGSNGSGSNSGSSGSGNSNTSSGVKLAATPKYVAYNATKGSGAAGPAIACNKTALVNAAVTRARTDRLWFAEKAWMFDHRVNDPSKVNYDQVYDLAATYKAHPDKWRADIARLEDHVHHASVITYNGGYNKTVMTTKQDGSRPNLSNLYVDGNMGCTLVSVYDTSKGFAIYQSAKGGLQFRHLASKPAASTPTTSPQPVFSTSPQPTTTTVAPTTSRTTTAHPTTSTTTRTTTSHAHPTTTVTTTTTAPPSTTTAHAGPFSEQASSGDHR